MAVSGGTKRELEPGDTLGGYRLEEALGEEEWGSSSALVAPRTAARLR